jgi:hypothetical protein
MLVAFIICQYFPFVIQQEGGWLLALTKDVTESVVQKVHISLKIIIL